MVNSAVRGHTFMAHVKNLCTTSRAYIYTNNIPHSLFYWNFLLDGLEHVCKALFDKSFVLVTFAIVFVTNIPTVFILINAPHFLLKKKRLNATIGDIRAPKVLVFAQGFSQKRHFGLNSKQRPWAFIRMCYGCHFSLK